MRAGRSRLCELMWTVIAAAIFLGIMETLSAPIGEATFLVGWIVSVIVLRLFLGWRVALLLSVAYGAVDDLLFPIKHTLTRPLAEETSRGVVIGIVFGAALAGLAMVAGWLIHRLAQITIGIRFPGEEHGQESRKN